MSVKLAAASAATAAVVLLAACGPPGAEVRLGGPATATEKASAAPTPQSPAPSASEARSPDAPVPTCAFLTSPAQVDGPVSADAVVADAQRGRAEMGLPSDVATVEGLLARDEVDRSFGFPMTPEEHIEVTARGPAAAVGAVLAYGEEQADTYGGLWLDNPAGGVLTVAFTANAERHEAALRERLGDAVFRVVTVANSLAELRAVQAGIDQRAPLGRGEVSGLGIPEDLNRVSVGVTNLDDAAVADLTGLVDPATVCVEPVDPSQAFGASEWATEGAGA